jgi:hypothetical protein
MMWVTALVGIIVVWRLEKAEKLELDGKYRNYRDAWNYTRFERDMAQLRSESAAQTLAIHDAVLAQQIVPVLRDLHELNSVDQIAYLKVLSALNDKRILGDADGWEGNQELVVFGEMLLMLSESIREMADAERRHSAEHAVTAVIEQPLDGRSE